MNWLWIASLLALVGVVLNIQRNALCFVIWLFTNATWAFVDWQAGIPAQAALHVVYTALALWGLYAWTRDEHRRGASSA